MASHRRSSSSLPVPETAWWKDADPAKAARKLWNESRMDQGRIAPGPTAQRPVADRTA